MKRAMCAVLLSLAVMIYVLPTLAAPRWFICTVSRAGVTEAGTMFIRVTDTANNPAFTNRFFSVVKSVQKEMLAVAITAITTGVKVQLMVDPDAAGIPPINRIYLMGE